MEYEDFIIQFLFSNVINPSLLKLFVHRDKSIS